MPVFIPPYLGDEVNSNAERKVFEILKCLYMPEAVVLHSLGLSKHSSKVYGEIDFLIICKQGIICLEVKGGAVECKNGIWSFTNRFGHTDTGTEGPFQQVIGSMFSLRNRIIQHFSKHATIKNVQFACGVIFPDIAFTKKSVDVIPEIIFDSRNYDDQITSYITRCFQYWGQRCETQNGISGQSLSDSDIRLIKDFLRGDFGFIPSLKNQYEEIEQRLLRLTREQYLVLDALSQNERLIIDGAAGTGKTLLATEFARRQYLAGKRVLYLTFNKNLAIYLNGNTELLNADILHFHGLISKYINVEYSNQPGYFENILPEAFYDYLCKARIQKYDVVIIDEGQDLITPIFLMCVDELLNGGLDNGNWCLFYDTNQNIYNAYFSDGMEYLRNISLAKWSLQCNCRNTKPIATTNTLLTNFPSAKVLQEDGEKVEYIVYTNKRELMYKLQKLIKFLQKEKFNLRDVIILSLCSYDRSVVSDEVFKSICSFSTFSQYNITNSPSNVLRFSTIHSFKGLESNIVILIDLDKLYPQSAEQLLYTAISRAKVMLYVVCDDNTKKTIDKRIVEGVLKV